MDWIRKERGRGLKGTVFKNASDEFKVEMIDVESVYLSIDGLEGKCIDKDFCIIALKKLPENYRQILKKYYMDDMDMKQIAKERGCTNSNISLIHKRAMIQVRKSCQNIIP